MSIDLTRRQQATIGMALTALAATVLVGVLLGLFLLLARFVAIFSSVFLPLFVAMVLALVKAGILESQTRHPMSELTSRGFLKTLSVTEEIA